MAHFNVSALCAPLIGGWTQEHAGWPWINETEEREALSKTVRLMGVGSPAMGTAGVENGGTTASKRVQEADQRRNFANSQAKPKDPRRVVAADEEKEPPFEGMQHGALGMYLHMGLRGGGIGG